MFLFLCLPEVAHTQTQTAPKPTASAAFNRASEDAYAKEPYVFESIERTVRFEADGKGTHELAIRVRIQSESAVREFGFLVYPYASSFESLDVLYARVGKPNGTLVETPAADMQELDSAVSREAPMYTDEREKHIAIKSLAAGDILEAKLRWTVRDPLAPGHFWFDTSYFTAGICLQETLRLDVPGNVPVKVRNSDPQPSITGENGRRIYTFKTSNLKKQEESKIPNWEKNPHGAPPCRCTVLFFYFLARDWRLVCLFGATQSSGNPRDSFQGGRTYQESDFRRRETPRYL